MLVLSRKKHESVVINDDTTIVVVEIKGDKVRLGIEAPKEVPVHRREVFDAIRRQQTSEVSKRVCGLEASVGQTTTPTQQEYRNYLAARDFINAYKLYVCCPGLQTPEASLKLIEEMGSEIVKLNEYIGKIR